MHFLLSFNLSCLFPLRNEEVDVGWPWGTPSLQKTTEIEKNSSWRSGWDVNGNANKLCQETLQGGWHRGAAMKRVLRD